MKIGDIPEEEWDGYIKYLEDKMASFDELMKERKVSDDEKMAQSYEHYEKMIRKLIADGVLTIRDMNFIETHAKEQDAQNILTLAKIGDEIVPFINSPDVFSDRAKCFLAASLYQASYEAVFLILRNISLTINAYHFKETGKKIKSDKDIRESTSACIKVLSTYYEKFRDVFDFLNPDIRGSIAHWTWAILDEGKTLHFKRGNIKIGKEELGMYVARTGMLLNIIFNVSTKLQLERSRALMKQLEDVRRRKKK